MGGSGQLVFLVSKELTGEHLFAPGLGSPGSRLEFVKEASNENQHTFRA